MRSAKQQVGLYRQARRIACGLVAALLLVSLWAGSSRLPQQNALELVKRRLTAPVDAFGRSSADRDLELTGAIALVLQASALSPRETAVSARLFVSNDELEGLAAAASLLDAAEAKLLLLSRGEDLRRALLEAPDLDVVSVWDLASLIILAGKRAQPAVSRYEEDQLRPLFSEALATIRRRLSPEGLYGAQSKAGLTARTIQQAQAIAALRAAAATPALGAGALLLDELDSSVAGAGTVINDPLDYGVLAAKAHAALMRHMTAGSATTAGSEAQGQDKTSKQVRHGGGKRGIGGGEEGPADFQEEEEEEAAYDEGPVFIGVVKKPVSSKEKQVQQEQSEMKPARGLSSEQCLLLFYLEPGDVPSALIAQLAETCVTGLSTPYGIRMGRVFARQAHELGTGSRPTGTDSDGLSGQGGGHVSPLEQAMLLLGAAKHASSLVGLGLEARLAAGQLALHVGAARRPEYGVVSSAAPGAGSSGSGEEGRRLLAVMAELQGEGTEGAAGTASPTEVARSAALASLRSLAAASLYTLPVLQRLDEERLKRTRGRAGHTSQLLKEAAKAAPAGAAQSSSSSGGVFSLLATGTDPHDQRLPPRGLPKSTSLASLDAASGPDDYLVAFDASDGDAADTAALLASPRVVESLLALLQVGVEGDPTATAAAAAKAGTGSGKHGTGRKAAKKAAALAAVWPSLAVGVRALTAAIEWGHALAYPELLCELPSAAAVAAAGQEGTDPAASVKLLESWAASRHPILPAWGLSPALGVSSALVLTGANATTTAARSSFAGRLSATAFTVDTTVLTRRMEQLGDAAGGAVAFVKSRLKRGEAGKAGGRGGEDTGLHSHHTRAADDTAPRVHLFYPEDGLPVLRAGGVTLGGVAVWPGAAPTPPARPGERAAAVASPKSSSVSAVPAAATGHTHGSVIRFAPPSLEYPVVRLQVLLEGEDEEEGSQEDGGSKPNGGDDTAAYSKRLRQRAGAAAASLGKKLSRSVQQVAGIWTELRSRLKAGGSAGSGAEVKEDAAAPASNGGDADAPKRVVVDVRGDGQPSSLGSLAALRLMQRWAAAGEALKQSLHVAKAAEAARRARAAEAAVREVLEEAAAGGRSEEADGGSSTSGTHPLARHMRRIINRLTRGVADGRAVTRSAWNKATDWGSRLVRTLFSGLPDRPDEDAVLAAAIFGAQQVPAPASAVAAPAAAVAIRDFFWADREVLDLVEARYKAEESAAGGGAPLPVLRAAAAEEGAADAADKLRQRREERRQALLQPNEVPAAPEPDADGDGVPDGEEQEEAQAGAGLLAGKPRLGLPRAVPLPVPVPAAKHPRADGADPDSGAGEAGQDDETAEDLQVQGLPAVEQGEAQALQAGLATIDLRVLTKRLGCEQAASEAQALLPPWHPICCPAVSSVLAGLAPGAAALTPVSQLPVFACGGGDASSAKGLTVSCAAVNDDFCDCGTAAGRGGAGADETRTGACSGIGGVFKCDSSIALAVQSGSLARPPGTVNKPLPSTWAALLQASTADLAVWGYIPVEKVGDGVHDCSDASDEGNPA